MLAVLFTAVSVPGPAQGRTPPVPVPAPAPTISAERLLEAARGALAAGKPDEAAFILKAVKPDEAHIDALQFLHGSVGMAKADWPTAIDNFRAVLARDPTLLRVRLDLALAYFHAGEDGSAAYHFRQALGADDLPPGARARALAFLDEIRRRKAWWITGSAALAPDSNINAATDARLVELFGLPAQLSEDARRTSGIGFNASVSGGYEMRLSPDLRLRTDAGLYTRTYGKSQFNEQVLSVGAGPRLLFDALDLRPRLTARLRRLGGEPYSRAAGAELAGDWLIEPTWRLSASAGAERVRYEGFLGEGRLYSAGLGLTHALGQTTLLRADTSFRREDVDSRANSWRERAVGFSVSQELPGGFVVTTGPVWRQRTYGAPQPILGPDARRDRTLGGRITVSSRRLDLFGFMPEVTLRHERRTSNLSLHDYTRTAAEIGLARSF